MKGWEVGLSPTEKLGSPLIEYKLSMAELLDTERGDEAS